MKVSEALQKGVEDFLTLTPQATAHMESHENPHAVTAAQVGLGEIINERQATAAELSAHQNASTMPHVAGSVKTAHLDDGVVTSAKLSNDAVIAEKIALGAVTEKKIAYHAVKEDKLGDTSVSTRVLKNGAVTENKIAADAVSMPCLAPALRKYIEGKVDKVDGLGLSQNSFTDSEKAKLAAINVTEGDLSVDLSSYANSALPLSLVPTGQRLIQKGSETISGVGEFVSAYANPYTKTLLESWTASEDGHYVVRATLPDSTQFTVDGPVGATCHCLTEDALYIPVVSEQDVLIYQRFIADGSGTATLWKTISLTSVSNIELIEIFVEESQIKLLYTACVSTEDHTRLHCFSYSGEELWKVYTITLFRTTMTQSYPQADYFAPRFRKAVDGVNGELFCCGGMYRGQIEDGPNVSMINAYRINSEGVITKGYGVRPNSVTLKDLYLDICTALGNRVYVWAYGDVYCFDADTSEKYTFLKTKKMIQKGRGLSSTADGKLMMAQTVQKPDTGVDCTEISFIDGTMFVNARDRELVTDSFLLDTIYNYTQLHGDSVLCYRYDEDTSSLVRDEYRLAKVYDIYVGNQEESA
ncbi:MAG: hypothetical protein PUB07_02535 [Clostridia bacterium]|nr:hypothetical protein [Clostridia bacterium]